MMAAYWHGDERLGALHALGSSRRLRGDQAIAEHPSGRTVLAAVDSILEMRPEDVAALDLDELQRILDWAAGRSTSSAGTVTAPNTTSPGAPTVCSASCTWWPTGRLPSPPRGTSAPDPAAVLRDYLSAARTASAKALAAKAVILLTPEHAVGQCVWPRRTPQ
jgi:hypothetical protein